MTPADWTPSGILVSGIIESDTEAIAEALEVLGCSRLTHTKALDDLGRRVHSKPRGAAGSPPRPSHHRSCDTWAPLRQRKLVGCCATQEDWNKRSLLGPGSGPIPVTAS